VSNRRKTVQLVTRASRNKRRNEESGKERKRREGERNAVALSVAVNRTFEKIASKKSYIEPEWRRAIGPGGQGGG